MYGKSIKMPRNIKKYYYLYLDWGQTIFLVKDRLRSKTGR
jgi:hypothetical protein